MSSVCIVSPAQQRKTRSIEKITSDVKWNLREITLHIISSRCPHMSSSRCPAVAAMLTRDLLTLVNAGNFMVCGFSAMCMYVYGIEIIVC